MLIIISVALIFTLLCLVTLKYAIWVALTAITISLFLQPLILFALLAVAGAIGYLIYRRRTGFKFNQKQSTNPIQHLPTHKEQ